MGATAALEQSLRSVRSKIRCAFIYGSVARGNEEAGSDIDLMVIGDVTVSELPPISGLSIDIGPVTFQDEPAPSTVALAKPLKPPSRAFPLFIFAPPAIPSVPFPENPKEKLPLTLKLVSGPLTLTNAVPGLLRTGASAVTLDETPAFPRMLVNSFLIMIEGFAARVKLAFAKSLEFVFVFFHHGPHAAGRLIQMIVTSTFSVRKLNRNREAAHIRSNQLQPNNMLGVQRRRFDSHVGVLRRLGGWQRHWQSDFVTGGQLWRVRLGQCAGFNREPCPSPNRLSHGPIEASLEYGAGEAGDFKPNIAQPITLGGRHDIGEGVLLAEHSAVVICCQAWHRGQCHARFWPCVHDAEIQPSLPQRSFRRQPQ